MKWPDFISIYPLFKEEIMGVLRDALVAGLKTRGRSETTIRMYVRAVEELLKFLGKPPKKSHSRGDSKVPSRSHREEAGDSHNQRSSRSDTVFLF